MKIYNEIVSRFNEETRQWEDVYEDSFDHDGEVMMMMPTATCSTLTTNAAGENQVCCQFPSTDEYGCVFPSGCSMASGTVVGEEYCGDYMDYPECNCTSMTDCEDTLADGNHYSDGIGATCATGGWSNFQSTGDPTPLVNCKLNFSEGGWGATNGMCVPACYHSDSMINTWYSSVSCPSGWWGSGGDESTYPYTDVSGDCIDPRYAIRCTDVPMGGDDEFPDWNTAMYYDECGVPNGSSVLDDCGVCDGDNSTCTLTFSWNSISSTNSDMVTADLDTYGEVSIFVYTNGIRATEDIPVSVDLYELINFGSVTPIPASDFTFTCEVSGNNSITCTVDGHIITLLNAQPNIPTSTYTVTVNATADGFDMDDSYSFSNYFIQDNADIPTMTVDTETITTIDGEYTYNIPLNIEDSDNLLPDNLNAYVTCTSSNDNIISNNINTSLPSACAYSNGGPSLSIFTVANNYGSTEITTKLSIGLCADADGNLPTTPSAAAICNENSTGNCPDTCLHWIDVFAPPFTVNVLQNLGCTDDSACNYDDSANSDDGSCYYENTITCYNQTTDEILSVTECDAECDAGYDESSDTGCTDSNACNYDSNANEDDGSCEYPSGCDNTCGSTLENDDCGVCGGDGSDDVGCGCFEAGPSGCDNTCGSTLVDDSCGVCGGDNSSCTGCMDDTACNYDEDATISGECEFNSFFCVDTLIWVCTAGDCPVRPVLTLTDYTVLTPDPLEYGENVYLVLPPADYHQNDKVKVVATVNDPDSTLDDITIAAGISTYRQVYRIQDNTNYNGYDDSDQWEQGMVNGIFGFEFLFVLDQGVEITGAHHPISWPQLPSTNPDWWQEFDIESGVSDGYHRVIGTGGRMGQNEVSNGVLDDPYPFLVIEYTGVNAATSPPCLYQSKYQFVDVDDFDTGPFDWGNGSQHYFANEYACSVGYCELYRYELHLTYPDGESFGSCPGNGGGGDDGRGPSCECSTDDMCDDDSVCEQGYDNCIISGQRTGICVQAPPGWDYDGDGELYRVPCQPDNINATNCPYADTNGGCYSSQYGDDEYEFCTDPADTPEEIWYKCTNTCRTNLLAHVHCEDGDIYDCTSSNIYPQDWQDFGQYDYSGFCPCAGNQGQNIPLCLCRGEDNPAPLTQIYINLTTDTPQSSPALPLGFSDEAFIVDVGETVETATGQYESLITIEPTPGVSGGARLTVTAQDQSSYIDTSVFDMVIQIEGCTDPTAENVHFQELYGTAIEMNDLCRYRGCKHPLGINFLSTANVAGSCTWPTESSFDINQSPLTTTTTIDELVSDAKTIDPFTITSGTDFNPSESYYSQYTDPTIVNTEMLEMEIYIKGSIGGDTPCGEGYSIEVTPTGTETLYGTDSRNYRIVTNSWAWSTTYLIPIDTHYDVDNVIKINFENDGSECINPTQSDGDRNLYVDKIRLRPINGSAAQTIDINSYAPPTGVTTGYYDNSGNLIGAVGCSTAGSGCETYNSDSNGVEEDTGRMPWGGTMQFTISSDFFINNNLWSSGHMLEESMAIPTTLPTYGKISGSAANFSLPFTYETQTDIIPITDTNLTHNYDYIGNTDIGDIDSTLLSPWSEFCQPFNEKLPEAFTFSYELSTYYHFTLFNNNAFYDSSKVWSTDIDVNTYLENNHPDHGCNNFSFQPENFVGGTLDLRVDQPTTTVDFDKLSGFFCSNGNRCTPEIILDERLVSKILGADANEAEIDVWEYSFEWSHDEGECSIELIVTDAEVAADDFTPPAVSVLQFKSSTMNEFVALGPITNGLNGSVFENLQEDFGIEGTDTTNNPDGIHWVYTTGFAGGIRDDLTLEYLNKAICTPGINTVKIQGAELISVENIRVTKHDGICNDLSQCGLTGPSFTNLTQYQEFGGDLDLEQFGQWSGITGGGTWMQTPGPNNQLAYKRTTGPTYSWGGLYTPVENVEGPGEYVISFWYRNLNSSAYLDIRQCSESPHDNADSYTYFPTTGCCSSWQGHRVDGFVDYYLTSVITPSEDEPWTFYEKTFTVLPAGSATNYADNSIDCTVECGDDTSPNSSGWYNCTPNECEEAGGTIPNSTSYYCPSPVTIHDDSISIRFYDRADLDTVPDESIAIGPEITVPLVTPLTRLEEYFDNAYYETIGWGVVVDNSVQQILGEGDNYNRCIAYGHCNQDGTLTRKGLISYDYKITVDLANSQEIVAPQEGFHDIQLTGNTTDIHDFIESYYNTPTKTMAVSGYRTDNECCTPGSENCWEAEQVQFKLDLIGIHPDVTIGNYITDPTFKTGFGSGTLGDSSIDSCVGMTCTVSDEESLFGQYSLKTVKDSGGDAYTSPHNGATSALSPASEGETWTLSAYCKTPTGTSNEYIQMHIFGLDISYHWHTSPDWTSVPIFTCTDEWTRHELTYTFIKDTTEYISFRLDGSNNAGDATTYWDGLQLEKGDKVKALTEQNSNQVIGDITLGGRILNSPLAFCNDDKFLMDRARGFGSSEYESIFVVDGTYGAADSGHPSYTDIATASDYYYPVINQYDGWTTGPVTISPGNIGEDVDTFLILKIKRYFHNIYSGEVADQTLPQITVNVIGVNPPHIHFLNYFDELKTQIGVQSSNVLQNQPTLQYYDNVGVNLLSGGIDEVGYQNPDTYTYDTTRDDFGVKSVGSIDFSTYEEIVGVQPRGELIVNGEIISNSFSAYTETISGTETYIWNNIIEAVNNFPSGNYIARLSNLSDENQDSNLKTVIIEARAANKKYDGVLSWNIDNSIFTWMYSLPIFNNLVHGTAYPILHVYEDFGSVDLLIAASDQDKFATLETQVISSDESILVENTTINDTFNNYMTSTGVSYGQPFFWSQYFYPWTNTYIIDYSSENLTGEAGFNLTHADLSHTNQKIRLTSTLEDGTPSDFNGEVDIAIRITDDNSSYDSIIFKLIVHPVNDPPIVIPSSDTELYMNNEFYPNDINIRIKTTDNEEGTCEIPKHLEESPHDNRTECLSDYTCGDDSNNDGIGNEQCTWTPADTVHLVDAQIVDGTHDEYGSYCWKVQQAVELIEAAGIITEEEATLSTGETVLPESLWGTASCTEMIYCSTICYEKFGMSREHAEDLCAFASYDTTVETISSYHTGVCNEDVIANTWAGTVSFRGGQEATCGSPQEDNTILSNRTWVDLFYDMLAYYGATIDMLTDPLAQGVAAACSNMGTFDTTDLDPFHPTIGCINGDGILNYLENIVGIPSDTADTMRTSFCNGVTCQSADPVDLTNIINLVASDPTTYSVSVCNGGEMNGKLCTVDEDCPSFEVPNFLNFLNEDQAYGDFLNYTGVPYLKNYIYINPDQNSVGTSRVRISVKDSGIAEDETYTHKRTGYSTVKVDIVGSSNGPTGDLLKEEIASFGIVPDRFKWTILGNDIRDEIPKKLIRDKDISLYAYHPSTTITDRILDNCITEGGRLNVDGECCTQTREIPYYVFRNNYYNTDNDVGGTNPVYYENEYNDELELYSEYFKGKDSNWCDMEFSTSWKYSEPFTNDNVGGFDPPNTTVNELDYLKSYQFKIIDVIRDYEEPGDQQYEDWWIRLGLDAGINPDTGNTYWADIWNATYREGWDTFGERDEEHPINQEYLLGEAPSPVYISPLMEQSSGDTLTTNDAFKKILEEGFEYKFEYPSIYKAIVYATDSYGIIGETWEALNLSNLIKFNQTVKFRYSPWQGLNVIMTEDEPTTPMPNILKVIEKHDKDKRPSLGLWYYDDMLGNKSTDWFVRHGNSEDGTHPYDGVEGNFTTTFEQEDVCANPIASSYGDTEPGGCSHDGSWSGYFANDFTTTPFISTDTVTTGWTERKELNFYYPTGYGSSEGPTPAATWGYTNGTYTVAAYCSDSDCSTESTCTGTDDSDCDSTWNASSSKTYTTVRTVNYNGVFQNIIQVPTTGTYTFVAYRDDGMTVEIDDVVVYNNWVSGNQGDSYGGEFTADLTAGNHNIKVKIYQTGGAAKWDLKWYVEADTINTDEALVTTAGNHIPTTDTTAILTFVWGAILGKGHAPNAEHLEDFYPDADVRNPISLGSSNAVLYKYYDKDLHPTAYQETSAPLTAQVFFYQRATTDVFGNPINIFETSKLLEVEMQNGNMYIGFLDWGDGSPIEYDKEPFQLGHSTILTHIYETSGIYEIKGEMIRVAKGIGGDDLTTVIEESEEDNPVGKVLGVTKFKEFLLRINVARDPDVEGEFKILGGTGYDFIPYNETTPVISGVSNHSLYKKQLGSINGRIKKWDNDEGVVGSYESEYRDEIIPIKYKFLGEKIKSELALMTADENLINPLVSAFTGSLASESSLVSGSDEVIIEFEDTACEFMGGCSAILGDGTIQYEVTSGQADWVNSSGVGCTAYDFPDDNTHSYRVLCDDQDEYTVFRDATGAFLFDWTSANDACDQFKRFECQLEGSTDIDTQYFITDYTDVENRLRAAFKDCEDECVLPVSADSIRGFFDGVVDAETGELVPDDTEYTQYQKPDGTYNINETTEAQETIDATNTTTPRLINTGIGTRFGELGDYLGDSDIGQVRYLDRPFDMWEMLGFENIIAGTPNTNQYWNNIIPEDYTLQYHRKGIGALPPLPDELSANSFEIVFGWGTLNKSGIEIEGTTYESVQILYSLTEVNSVSKVEIVFEGLTLPEAVLDTGLEGVLDGNFRATLTDNKLTLEGIESATLLKDANVLLLNLPILNREDKFGFSSIRVYNLGGVEVPSNQFYINNVYGQPYPYVSKYYGGIGNIVINEDSPQSWIPYCDDNINITEDTCTGNWIYPYYPVLPKINKIGKFDEQNEDGDWIYGLGLQTLIETGTSLSTEFASGDLEGGHAEFSDWPWIMAVKSPYTISFWFKWIGAPDWIGLGVYYKLQVNLSFPDDPLTVTFGQMGGEPGSNPNTHPQHFGDSNSTAYDQSSPRSFTFNNLTPNSLVGNWTNMIIVADDSTGVMKFDLYINNIKSDSCTNCEQSIENTYVDFEDLRCIIGNGACAFDEMKVWNDAVYNEDTNTLDGSSAELLHYWSFGEHPMDTYNDSDASIMVNAVTVDVPWMDNLEELSNGNCSIEPCYQDIETLQSSVNPGSDGKIYLNNVDVYTNEFPLLSHSLLQQQGYKLTFDAKVTDGVGGDECSSGTFDCTGECEGPAVYDECGVCDGDGLSCAECSDDACNPPECNMYNDCLGVCGGTAVEDSCGICGGDDSSCTSDGQVSFCDIVDRLISEGNSNKITQISINSIIDGSSTGAVRINENNTCASWVGSLSNQADVSPYFQDAYWVLQVNEDFNTSVFTCSPDLIPDDGCPENQHMASGTCFEHCSVGYTGEVPYEVLLDLTSGYSGQGNYMMYVPETGVEVEPTPQTWCGLIELLSAEGSVDNITQIGVTYFGDDDIDGSSTYTTIRHPGNPGDGSDCSANWIGGLSSGNTDISEFMGSDWTWIIKHSEGLLTTDYFYCSEAWSYYCFPEGNSSFAIPPLTSLSSPPDGDTCDGGYDCHWETYTIENGIDLNTWINPGNANYLNIAWPFEQTSRTRRTRRTESTLYLDSGIGLETIGELTDSYNSFGIYFFARTSPLTSAEPLTDVFLQGTPDTIIKNIKLEHLPGRIWIHRGNLDPSTGLAYHSNFYTDDGGMIFTARFDEAIPFGSPNRLWNEDDIYAPITSPILPEEWINYSLIDLDFSKIEDKVLSDIGPIDNFGILIDDYKIHYEGEGGVKLENQKPMLRTKIGKTKKDKPY